MTIILLFLFAALPSAILLGVSDQQNFEILSMSLMPSILCGIIILAKRDKDYFSPLYMLFYMTTIGIFLKAYFFLYLDTDGLGQTVALAGLDHEIMYGGAKVLIVGVAAMLLGYWLIPIVRQTGEVSLFISKTRGLKIFAIVALIGGVFFLWSFYNILNIGQSISDGQLSAKRIHEDTVGSAPRGAALGYLRLGAQTLPQVAFFLLFTQLAFMRKHRGIKFGTVNISILMALAVVSSTLPFLTSSRLEMLYLVVISIIVWHYSIKKISFFKGGVIAIALILALTALGQIRSASSGRLDDGYTTSITSILSATLARAYFMDIGKTSVIVDAVPERVDYQNGETLVLFLYGPIPRSIWPEKPVIRIGLMVGQEIFNRPNDSGVPPGFVGELYMNFGKIGVAVGMFVLGILNALLYKHTILTRNSANSVLIYALGTLILSFTLLTGDVTITMSQIFRYGIILLIGLFFARYWSTSKLSA